VSAISCFITHQGCFAQVECQVRRQLHHTGLKEQIRQLFQGFLYVGTCFLRLQPVYYVIYGTGVNVFKGKFQSGKVTENIRNPGKSAFSPLSGCLMCELI
jgi:hypothetical protein